MHQNKMRTYKQIPVVVVRALSIVPSCLLSESCLHTFQLCTVYVERSSLHTGLGCMALWRVPCSKHNTLPYIPACSMYGTHMCVLYMGICVYCIWVYWYMVYGYMGVWYMGILVYGTWVYGTWVYGCMVHGYMGVWYMGVWPVHGYMGVWYMGVWV